MDYYPPGRNYIDQVHAALEEEIQVNGAACAERDLIRKVPAVYKNNAKHYEPVSWRFGLHNCPDNTLPISVTDGFKIKVAGALKLSGTQWDDFCKKVVTEPKEHWGAVYDGSSHAKSYSIEQIRCLLSLDALSLVVFLQTFALGKGQDPKIEEGARIRVSPAVDLVMKNPVMQVYKETLWHDIWLVGNQIPMELLQRVVGVLTSHECHETWGDVVMPAWEHEDWQKQYILRCVPWHFFYGPRIDADSKYKLFEDRRLALHRPLPCRGIHLLDSVYGILRGPESSGRRSYYFRTVPSATHLEACGVTIRGEDFTRFEDISFKKGVLRVPFLRIQHGTETFLRNLIVHERLKVGNVNSDATTEPRETENKTLCCGDLKSSLLRREESMALSKRKGRRQTREFSVSCYTNFMESLVKTPKDVDLLVQQGVLSVRIGSYAMVVDMFKCINGNIPEPKVTAEFCTMLQKVNSYSKQRRNQLRFEFKREHCKPWVVLSVLAATFVTVATGIQAYAAVIGSYGMEPKFYSHP